MEQTLSQRLGGLALLASFTFGAGCAPQDGAIDSKSAATSRSLPEENPGADRWRSYPPVVAKALSNASVLIDGQEARLNTSNYTVLVFANPNCPMAARSVRKLNELQERFREEPQVTIIGVFPGTGESRASLQKFGKEYQAHFPLMIDKAQTLTNALHAERSPEVFVLDSDFKIVYRGAIDDGLSVRGGTRARIQNDYLNEVLSDLATVAPLKHTVTDAEGCLLDRENLPDLYPTFNRDIGPLIEKHCTYCHRPDDVASIMPLTSYEEISNSAQTLEERITDRLMPPWRVDGRFGKFANDSRLDVNEIWAFRTWEKQHRTIGSGSFTIDSNHIKADTRLNDPDAIVYMTPDDNTQHTIPAHGVLPYQHFFVKTNFDQDKWLVASEVRALAPEVVHHINVFLLPPNDEAILTNTRVNRIAKMVARRNFGIDPKEFDGVFRLYGQGMRRQLFLIGNYTPSHTALKFSNEHGVLIPKGSEIVFECHYTPNGKETRDRSALALKFAPVIPEDAYGKQVITRSGAPKLPELKMQPGETKELTSTLEYFADAKLISLRPHMHLRGHDFKATVERPGQKPETILYIPRWDYQWQVVYNFEKAIDLPAGSKLHMTYRWDNSEQNTMNPDPSALVNFGTKIENEMGMAWPTYAYKDPKTVRAAEEKLEDALTGREVEVEGKD